MDTYAQIARETTARADMEDLDLRLQELGLSTGAPLFQPQAKRSTRKTNGHGRQNRSMR